MSEVMHLDEEEKKALREERRRQFREMTFSRKLEYIFMYYKWAIALVIAIIFLISGVRSWIRNIRTKDLLGILAANCTAYDTDGTAERIKAELGSTGRYEAVQIYANLFADPDTGEFNYQSRMAFLTHFQAGDLDVLLMPQSVAENLRKEDNIFVDLGDIIKEEDIKSSGARLEDGFLILGSENPVYEDFIFAYEPVYAALVKDAPHRENAETYLRQLAGI